ncbi:hypothetical protein BC940DRAFT_345102 [Gongronella butleri]|nr:hypothetical protein BC940DRAFT_345102 [Gongronella butleri]
MTSRGHSPLLCIGDEVLFYDEGKNLLVAENPLETRACTRPTTSLTSESLGASVFKVEPLQNIADQRALDLFLGDSDVDSVRCVGSPEMVAHLDVLLANAEKERAQNDTERRRLIGKPVVYGQVIQLYNAHFNKYLAITGKTCENDVSHLQVNLSNDIAGGSFRIVPRYRIRVDGEPVRLEDTFAIQCVRPEGYLNVDPVLSHSTVYDNDYYEVYSYTRISSWTMSLHCNAPRNGQDLKQKYIHSAQYIRFYHKEIEGYLESDVLKADKHDVRLKRHVLNPLDPKESDSPLAFWEIELVDPSKGSLICWNKSVRIRHAASRAYLHIDPSNVSIHVESQKISFSLGLVKEPAFNDANDATLFTLVPVSEHSGRAVPYGSYIRIQHIATRCWLHAATLVNAHPTGAPNGMASSLTPASALLQQPTTYDVLSSAFGPRLVASSSNHHPSASFSPSHHRSIQSMRFSTADALQAGANAANAVHSVTATQDFFYHDCFTVTVASARLTKCFNLVNEYLPRLYDFMKRRRRPDMTSSFPIPTHEFENISTILINLIRFCTKSSEDDVTRRCGLPIPYHQSLLCENGVIEAVIRMIQIPFSIAKRRKVRRAILRGDDKDDGMKIDGEQVVALHASDPDQEYHLKVILTLCYNLLRVFLLPVSDYEEQIDHKRNQDYVAEIAGDSGLQLFLDHLDAGIGATPMLINLVQGNEKMVQKLLDARPDLLDTLVTYTTLACDSAAHQMYAHHQSQLHLFDDDDDVHNEPEADPDASVRGDTSPQNARRYSCEMATPNRLEHPEFGKCLDLLGTLCQTDSASGSVTFSHRDYVLEQLFDHDATSNSPLIQCRLIHDTGAVEICVLAHNRWLDLDTLMCDATSDMAGFMATLLQLVCALSQGSTNTKSLQLLRDNFSKDICLKSLGYVGLPNQIRARFCDLLRVLHIKKASHHEVLLSDFTMQYDLLQGSSLYPRGASVDGSHLDLFERLKHWTLIFFDEHRHIYLEDHESMDLLSSVIRMVAMQLKLGYFAEPEDVKRLFRAMVDVLDGRSDARSEAHWNYLLHQEGTKNWVERFLHTETNQAVMNIKIQILEIFDLIFDLRVHVRMNKLATKWKQMETNLSMDAFLSLRDMLSSIFSETVLRHRENSLMPILKDILKYQYAPLKQVAVRVMHRMYHDCEDLFNKSTQSLILYEPQHVFVYHGIKKRLARLRSQLVSEKLGAEHLPLVSRILHEFLALLNGKTIDYDDRLVVLQGNDEKVPMPEEERATHRNIYTKILMNLNVHHELIRILESLGQAAPQHLAAGIPFIDVIRLCLDLLTKLVHDDEKMQGAFIMEHLDALIDASSHDKSLSSLLNVICGNNLYISLRMNEHYIERILELSRGQDVDYLRLLQSFMKVNGKLIKRNQDTIMRIIMDNRRLYVPFASIDDLLKTDRLDYCLELIELLSICGHGENTYGQSFARTVFSMDEVTLLVQGAKTPLPVKTKVLRFLTSIYLDIGDMGTSSMEMNAVIRNLMAYFLQQLLDAVARDLNDGHYAMLSSYLHNGVMVVLRSVFEYHVKQESVWDVQLYELCSDLADACIALLPDLSERVVTNPNLLACLDSMINVAGFHGSSDPATIRQQLQILATRATDHGKTNVHRHALGSVNTKFHGFIRTLKAHRSILELQEEEFKQLGSHYNLSDVESANDVRSLIDFLSMMTHSKEGSDEKNEYYQVATMRLLQEIPERYIRQQQQQQLQQQQENQQHFDMETLEKNKVNAQNTLNRLGCTLVTQNLLSSPRRSVFKAALTLLIALLDGGNKNVQDQLEEYFYSIREERFFYSFHRRLQTDIASLKEAQQHITRMAAKLHRQQMLLMPSNQQNQQFHAIAANQPAKHSTLHTQLHQQHQLHHLNRLAPLQRSSHSLIMPLVYQQQPLDQLQAVNGSSRPLLDDTKRLGHGNTPKQAAKAPKISLASLMSSEISDLGTSADEFDTMKNAMRAVQLMVEGHNIRLQTYLAKQPDNIKSFNIVQDVVDYLHAIAPLCNVQNIRLIIQVLDTITELAQGCPENQLTIYNGKIVHPVNAILAETYDNCPRILIQELKSKVVICLLSLLEGGIENSETIFREMAGSLDLATVVQNMDTIYASNRQFVDSPHAYAKMEGGFLYCMLIMTLFPALDATQRALLDGNGAFQYFQSNTGKIEVIMEYGQEKQLSRVLFPIPDICKYFREETKERFLWNVKRDSPSAKIEDFVEQSSIMIYEIENQARVTYNEHLSILTRYSSLWWKVSLVVTILLNMLMLNCSTILHRNGEACPTMNSVTRIFFGLVHLALWHLSTAEFYFIQLPVLVKRRLGSKLSLKHTTVVPEESPSVLASFFSEEHLQGSFLLASVMEPQFVYHVGMVLLSYLGLWNPMFYAVHLLDFVFRDRILQGVIASITLNGSSISHTALLAIVVIYMHSVMAYKYFHGDFDISKGLYCRSLSECFVNVLTHGLRGGIGDVFTEADTHDDISRGWRIGFEMSFYLVVVVFLLNAIFGIIFDTFGHLRDERSAVQQDMKNSCFICSIPAVEFQRHAKRGFDDHVKNDHNIWQYLFFLVHLKYKDKTEYTGPESYVASCLKDANYSFFPINRALCLSQNESNDSERLEKLEEMTQAILTRLAKLEDNVIKLSDVPSRSRSNSILLSPLSPLSV